MKATNWDTYYQQPAAPTKVTRRISERKILSLLRPFVVEGTKICECGGANSCFIDGFLSSFQGLGGYHVIDFNAFGVSLLAERFQSNSVVTWEVGDLLGKASSPEHDIVYSVGLIEHFDKSGTARCVEAHFDLCKPGGVVLMTFPTPTMLYKAIRTAAELTRQWQFPDERPLSFDEVEAASASHFKLHASINWAIGLTQGYLMFRKASA